MKKKYSTPTEIIVAIDTTELLAESPLSKNLNGLPEGDPIDKTQNQFSRDNNNLWDSEW